VMKTDPNGKIITHFDFGQGVTPAGAAIDPQGNVLVVGTGQTGFVARLDNNLTTVMNTATNPGFASAITTDAAGNVYIAGSAADGFPTTPGSYQPHGPPAARYAFVAKLSRDLGTILYATLFGSASADCNSTFSGCRQVNGGTPPAQTSANSVAVGPDGSIVIAGNTNGTPAPLSQAGPYTYGFLAKFSSDLSSLLGQVTLNGASFFASLGTINYNFAGNSSRFYGVAIDTEGNIVLVGIAVFQPADSPAGTIQPLPPQGYDLFVVKFGPGLNYIWGTFFGANGFTPTQLALDSAGHVWISGSAQVGTLPGSPPTSPDNVLEYVPFVAELTSDGTSIINLESSVFGGGPVAAAPFGATILGSGSTQDSFLLTAPLDQPSLLMVANSANNQSSGTIAPIELISLFGFGIGPANPLGGQVADGAFTKSLGGYQVLFNGVPAPLLYAGPNQINVVSPAAISGQSSVDIEVVGPLGTTAFPTVFVAAVSPQIFSQQRLIQFGLFYEPRNYAVAYNQDGTLNAESNPAPAGSVATVWAAGTGMLDQPLADGAISGSGAALNVPIDLSYSSIAYVGQAPEAVQGLTQINVQVPSNIVGNQLGVGFEQGGRTTVGFVQGGYSDVIPTIWVSKN
jgi:uncharacterized protein (TIGR03437 family)